ncbi:hypothetical protein [Stappia sp. WLB 29]|uniref:hypothetical protein n=1 Tax=Stappia sp. WLB 29 TaxID=2925220 RepID=UPI0020BF1BEA|nr:hypothetical protein [Stappia sp. WLB 29]
MSERRYADISAEERMEWFHESYGNVLDGGRTFECILLALGDYLSKLADVASADAAMAALLNDWLGAETRDAREWRTYVSDNSSMFFSAMGHGPVMHNLLAYAEYGIVLPVEDEAGDWAEHIQAMIDQVDAFWQATPIKQWGLEEFDEIGPLLTWAKGRWALDNNEPIEPAALARLGNVSERSIRNLMSKKDKGLRSENGKVLASDALAWLRVRPDYWDSIWQRQEHDDHEQAAEPVEDAYVFVPVSRDGSIFHPGLRGANGYRVGAKGSERDFDTFEAALTHLHALSHPYWRRQNANGAWVIVSGIRWERLSERELSDFADDPERRLQSVL